MPLSIAQPWGGFQSRVVAKWTGMTIAACYNKKQGRSPLQLAEFTF